MAELDWGLLAQPDFAGSAFKAYSLGQKQAKEQRTQAAVSAYRTNPTDTKAQDELMLYAPDYFKDVLSIEDRRHKQAGQEAAAPFIAKGDYRGAAQQVLGSDAESADRYLKMYDSLNADQKRVTDAGSAAWAAAWPTIKELPKGTGARQEAYNRLVAPHLAEAGAKPDQLTAALPNLDSDEWGETNYRLALGAKDAREASKPISDAPGTVYRDPKSLQIIAHNEETPPAGFEPDPQNPGRLRPKAGGPADPSYIHTTAKDRAEGGREGAPPQFIVYGPNGGKPERASPSEVVGQVLEKFRTGGDAALTPQEKDIKDRYFKGPENGGLAALFGGGGAPAGGGYGGAGAPAPAPSPRAAPPPVNVQRPPSTPAAPGSSRLAPVRPASKAEAARLRPGTWFQDPAGNILQKR